MSQSVQTGCSLPESALKPALALALEIEHSPMGLLMLPNEHSGTLEPVVAEGLTEEQSRRFGAQRPGIGPIGMAYAQQRRVTIRDVLSESDGSQGALREIARAVGFRGLDVVPLTLDGGSVVGAVTALFRVARHPSARSARLSALCGRLMALALDHARLRADAERRREIVEAMARARVQLVAQLGHELRTPLSPSRGTWSCCEWTSAPL